MGEVKLDAIQLEILWNRLLAIVEEQARALMHTAFTTIVRESGDLSAGIFDPSGNMVAQAVTGTPGHINSMATCIHYFMDAFPESELEPGDVLITNDPWYTSGHLHDFTVVTPIFRGGKLVAYSANTTHVLDIGGIGFSTDARSVYEEGLYVPIMKIYKAGERNDELFNIIEGNVRAPKPVLGDLYAQFVCNNVGGARLIEMMDEFGLESIEPLANEIIERTEKAMRDSIRVIPDGVYTHSVTTDGFDEPIIIKAKVTVSGDEIKVDYEGTSPQSDRGINVVLNYTQAYTTFGLKCLVSPDVPNNEGSFRPVTTTAPEGSILNPKRPAPVGARHNIGHFLSGVVIGAITEALPEKGMADGYDSLWITQLSGVTGHEEPFSAVIFSVGGTGALPGKDGLSATPFPSNVRGVSAEVLESVYPLFIKQKELWPDSAGAGCYRGGFGHVMEIYVNSDKPYLLAPMYDRTSNPPQGREGGKDGNAGEALLHSGERLHPKRRLEVDPDKGIIIRLPGGGGYGDPRERLPEKVLDDVISEMVSVEKAREDYGVVINAENFEINWEETEALRKK